MDQYFEQQIANAGRARARYWSRLDYSSAANFDRSADAYRKDWAQYLGVPDPGAAPLNVKRVKVREFDGYISLQPFGVRAGWLEQIDLRNSIE
jgi:hypothetical protein